MTTQELKQQTDKVLGNSIRCLLPSYWWKRLFHQVVDRIDEVEQKMDNLPDGVPIVSSIAELDSLNLNKGRVASVVDEIGFSQCYQPTDEEMSNLVGVFPKLTRVESIDIKNNPLEEGEKGLATLIGVKGSELSILRILCKKQDGFTLMIAGGDIYGQTVEILLSPGGIESLNKILSENDMRFLTANPDDIFEEGPEASLAALDKKFTINTDVNVYVKGLTWERFLKEGEVVENVYPDDADFTFVAAFDTSLNDTTTTSEKSANKTNASLYYQSIQNGIKPKVALKFSFRDSASEVPVEVVPSFIGMVSMYNGKYQSSYGANAMVFAKLDIGDRFAGLTFDLIMDPDIGSVLVPHIDASEINILHARVVSNAITSDGLTSLALKQNQELYKYALSAPVAVYVSNTRQLIPARVSQGSGFLAVYAGDYVFEFYDDGTIVDHPVQKEETATVEYVNEKVAKKVDKEEVIANEEVVATAINDLNARINNILARLINAGI